MGHVQINSAARSKLSGINGSRKGGFGVPRDLFQGTWPLAPPPAHVTGIEHDVRKGIQILRSGSEDIDRVGDTCACQEVGGCVAVVPQPDCLEPLVLKLVVRQALRSCNNLALGDFHEHLVDRRISITEISEMNVRGRLIKREGWVQTKQGQELFTTRRLDESSGQFVDRGCDRVVGTPQECDTPQQHGRFGHHLGHYQGAGPAKYFVSFWIRAFSLKRIVLRLMPERSINRTSGDVQRLPDTSDKVAKVPQFAFVMPHELAAMRWDAGHSDSCRRTRGCMMSSSGPGQPQFHITLRLMMLTSV